ncbi:protein spindle-F isoform X2 [Periplaneta americana]|uniref:protein spindle-F isoform X2 n=1 Tax=Periplaneta americana TaxID=6978 RepID=UPI0037E990FB
MSLGKKSNDSDQSSNRPRSLEEAGGSHFALQVALQTMKERCQNLQQRLGTVEEENLCLRIENRKRRSDSTSAVTGEENLKSEIDNLEEKVAQLTRQKSQLTHHLFMVATENRQLWNRLSLLTQANHNLGSHLSKISSTLSRHNSSGSITLPKLQTCTSSLTGEGDSNQVSKKGSDPTRKDSEGRLGCEKDKEVASPFSKSNGALDESLEEISLKIIKSLLQEKTELEDQYAQMVEIQSDSSSYSVQNLGFGFLEDSDEGLESIKQLHRRQLELRDALLKQQQQLRTGVVSIEQALKAGAVCSQCRGNPQEADIEAEVESLRKWGMPEGTSYSEGIRRQLDQVAEPPHLTHEERICPMCGKLYNKGIPFQEFQQHVSDHFPEEDEEEACSLIDNFEVIT